MSATPFHVVIIGGGLGGLCLAQGLKKAGIGVAVYERDRSRTDRLQGYRIHINPAGSRALHDCLPPDLYDAFVANCGKSNKGFTFLDQCLRELLAVTVPDVNPLDPVDSHKSASRITLRQVLLAGLDDIVHFDKTFVRFEKSPDGTVVAHFGDGTAAAGDVLVAADGANSRVRKQFLPQAERIETGVFTVIGKVPLTDEVRTLLPPQLFDGPASVMASESKGLFIAVQEFRRAPQGAREIGGNDSAADLHPGLLFDNTADYVMWALGARREKFPIVGDPEVMDGSALQQVVLGMMQHWHPRLRRLVELSDPSTMTPTPIHTSVPIPHWETKRITLLGDAIHSMTPYRGIGANTALRDAALLCRNLTAVHRGEKPLLAAIHDYETEMVEYGFAAVRSSMKAMKQAVSDNRFALAIAKAVFRAMNAMPPVKRRAFRNMGN